MLEDGITTTILCTFFIIFFVLILNFFQYLARESYIHIRDVTKEHNWKSIKKENKVNLYI